MEHRHIRLSEPVSIAVTDDEILSIILQHEGATYTNHPADRGGPTKWGITLDVLRAWRRRHVTAEDVRNLTEHEAGSIYRANYISPFNPLGATTLRANVIDMSVNAGIVRGIKLLQQTVGASVDGIFGPETVRLSVSRDWNPLFVGVRLSFYERIIENNSTQIIWRNGWRRRALSFYGKAHRMPDRMFGAPAYGHMGKAYLDAAA
jgi:lysozyme family protein